jgi:hypothetical protein
MSIHNVVNLSRHSHEGRGLFVLGTSADANAAVARGLQTAGIPKSSVLRVHVRHPCTSRALVRSICEEAGLMTHPSETLIHMTQSCLEVIREKNIRVLHIDRMHSDVGSPTNVHADLCCQLFRFLLKEGGISLVINAPRQMMMFDGMPDLIRRFRFLSADDVGPDDIAYLLRWE